MRSLTLRKSLFLFGLSLALLLTACPSETRLSVGYTVYYLKPPVSPLSTRVLLMADTHFHNLYNDGARLATPLAELASHTAIRPAQLDLYSPDVLQWVLEHFTAELPVVHLGDADDLSCTGEYDRFLEIMRGARQGWVMAPGNHDGYYYGNAHLDGEKLARNLQLSRADWEAACRGGGEPLTRDRFLKSYLGAVSSQTSSSAQDLARYLAGHPLPADGSWRYEGPEHALLRAAAWHIDPEKPWSSYLVQEIDLSEPGSKTPFVGILWDTSNYAAAPVVIPDVASFFQRLLRRSVLHVNAGLSGAVGAEQLLRVEQWLAGAHAAGKVPVLMGHHDFSTFPHALRDRIETWRRDYGLLMYISAHTHKGQYYVWGDDRSDRWLELNIGSELDWPSEVRTLQFGAPEGEQRVVMDSPLQRLNQLYREGGADVPQCRSSWEAGPGDPDYYLAYMAYTPLASPRTGSPLKDLKVKGLQITTGALPPVINQEEAQRRMLDVLLSAYDRLFKAAPTRTAAGWPGGATDDATLLAAIAAARSSQVTLEQKIALLEAIEKFDAARTPVEPRVRRDFRLCQALFAGKYEYEFWAPPQVDDEVIAFPRK